MWYHTTPNCLSLSDNTLQDMSNQNYSTQNGVSPEYNARSIIDTQYLATTNCLSQSANTFPDPILPDNSHQNVVS